MKRTVRINRESPAEAGQLVEDGQKTDVATGVGWNRTESVFIGEVDEQGNLRMKYDPIQTMPSVAVFTAVSNITGRDPLELDPLQESIDCDALNSLFTSNQATAIQLTFQYSRCEITVDTTGVITVASGE